MDEVFLFVRDLIALCKVFGGFVVFFGKFAGENSRNASLLPEVPDSVYRRERENKQKLSEPKVRSVQHGLERAKMIENRHINSILIIFIHCLTEIFFCHFQIQDCPKIGK